MKFNSVPYPKEVQELINKQTETKKAKQERIVEACPECGHEIDKDWLACPECGHQVREKCTNCDSLVEPAWQFCPYCSSEI